MKTTKEIFEKYNKKLKTKLIPLDKVIECNSVNDPNDIAFEHTLKQNGLND